MTSGVQWQTSCRGSSGVSDIVSPYLSFCVRGGQGVRAFG